MLAVDFLEAFGGLLVFLDAQLIERVVVELLDRRLDVVLVVVRRTWKRVAGLSRSRAKKRGAERPLDRMRGELSNLRQLA